MGVRVCTTKHAEDSELHQWMARGFGLASIHCFVCIPDRQRHPDPGFYEQPFLRAYSLVSFRESRWSTGYHELIITRQGTLMTMAVGAFAISFNAFAAKHLPLFEGIILIMFLIGFFVIIIPLWVLAPRASVGDVFGKFENWGGW
jgi:hypothetical protein